MYVKTEEARLELYFHIELGYQRNLKFKIIRKILALCAFIFKLIFYGGTLICVW